MLPNTAALTGIVPRLNFSESIPTCIFHFNLLPLFAFWQLEKVKQNWETSGRSVRGATCSSTSAGIYKTLGVDNGRDLHKRIKPKALRAQTLLVGVQVHPNARSTRTAQVHSRQKHSEGNKKQMWPYCVGHCLRSSLTGSMRPFTMLVFAVIWNEAIWFKVQMIPNFTFS